MTTHPAMLSTAPAALIFALGGRATFTLVSRKTGTRFTYKVVKAKEPRNGKHAFFVSVLTGPENTNDYTFFSTIFKGDSLEFRHSDRGGIGADAPSAKAFAWFYRKVLIEDCDPATVNLEIWHSGRCCRCNRKLTVPESIASGIGPECATRM